MAVHQAPATAKSIHFITLDDEFGLMDVIVRPDVYQQYAGVLRTSGFLAVAGVLQRSGAVPDGMVAQPCRPGARHSMALHIYFGHNSGPWLFGSWRLFRQVVGAQYDPLAYWFTEYGVPNVEGQLEGRGAPDCGEIHDELASADAIFRDEVSIAGYHAYSVGGGTEWLDLSPCLPVM